MGKSCCITTLPSLLHAGVQLSLDAERARGNARGKHLGRCLGRRIALSSCSARLTCGCRVSQRVMDCRLSILRNLSALSLFGDFFGYSSALFVRGHSDWAARLVPGGRCRWPIRTLPPLQVGGEARDGFGVVVCMFTRRPIYRTLSTVILYCVDHNFFDISCPCF